MKTIKIEYNQFADNPLDYIDDVRLICEHKRYNLGSNKNGFRGNNFDTLDEYIHQYFAYMYYDEIKEFIQSRYVITNATKYLDYYSMYISSYYFDGYNKQFKNVLNQFIKKNFNILPLYMYEHGGITISTTPFSCSWDSGTVGFAYSKKDIDTNVIKNVVKEYDKYIKGEAIYINIMENDAVIETLDAYSSDDYKLLKDELSLYNIDEAMYIEALYNII